MLSWYLWVGLFASISLTAHSRVRPRFDYATLNLTTELQAVTERHDVPYAAVDSTAVFRAGQKFQIVLSSVPDVSKSPIVPTDAPVFDIDLFDSNSSTVAGLKGQGKIVICYFSAGTYEPWRDDASKFQKADQGKALPQWPDEKWLKITSSSVRSIMTARIQLAAQKGCDAIDPDNTGKPFFINQNDNGLNLKSSDSIDYMKFLSSTASGLGMQTGLKNSLDILDQVQSVVAFAVNEQCAVNNECTAYNNFVASGKPVFHIEYPANIPQVSSAEKNTDCQSAGVSGLSTVMKNLTLSGLTVYCDGSEVTTPTIDGSGTKPWSPPGGSPRPPHTTTSKPGSPPTSRPGSLPTTTTTQGGQPTGGGGGCKSKHWDQCGGQNWKGCTECEAGLTCKGVSPPYYYQCL